MMTEQERALMFTIAREIGLMSGNVAGWDRLITTAQPTAEPKPNFICDGCGKTAGILFQLEEGGPNMCQPCWQLSKKPTEPKPSVGVSDDAKWAAHEAWRRFSPPAYPPAMEAALDAAASYITAAKDAELAAVIRDNNAKIAEIERLKALNKTMLSEAITMDRELRANRNPDIDAAADAGLAAYHGTYANPRMQWRAVASAILSALRRAA